MINGIKQYLKIMIALVFFLIIIRIFVINDHIAERVEAINAITPLIASEAERMLGEIYGAPIVLITGRRTTFPEVFFGPPSTTHGISRFVIEFLSSRDTVLIYWEMADDLPVIKRIVSQSTGETIFEQGIVL